MLMRFRGAISCFPFCAKLEWPYRLISYRVAAQVVAMMQRIHAEEIALEIDLLPTRAAVPAFGSASEALRNGFDELAEEVRCQRLLACQARLARSSSGM